MNPDSKNETISEKKNVATDYTEKKWFHFFVFIPSIPFILANNFKSPAPRGRAFLNDIGGLFSHQRR